jgi:hypothetical protein
MDFHWQDECNETAVQPSEPESQGDPQEGDADRMLTTMLGGPVVKVWWYYLLLVEVEDTYLYVLID